MEPIRRSQLERNISSATVEFMDTGETKNLETKYNSYCHFFEAFQVENDTIKLRLDWSDLDENGYPTLDADFFDSQTGKKHPLKSERGNAHHTPTINSKERSYEWKFKNCKRHFKIKVCWTVSITESMNVADSCSAEVIQAGERIVDF